MRWLSFPGAGHNRLAQYREYSTRTTDPNSKLHCAMESKTMPLGRHRFSAADQERFGSLSGDHNPLHMDPVAARRLVTGRAVVHGIHTLLHMLEVLPDLVDWPQGQIECEFLSPVCVDDEVVIAAAQGLDGALVFIASVEALPCTRITLTSRQLATKPLPLASEAHTTPRSSTPLERAPESWIAQHLRLDLPGCSFAPHFPRACAQLGERRVAALALLSYFVGMVCPGQHSIFASLVIRAGNASDSLDFHVRSFHSKYRQFQIEFGGCICGEIKAFVRTPPQEQPITADLLEGIRAHEFEGRNAWVIGGSRGLGELAAKILGAGGADVTLTYSTGAADAHRVAEDINQSGRGRAKARRLDIAHEDFESWVQASAAPDAVLYFATPRIYRKKPSEFQPALLSEFLDFYVFKLESLCRALERHTNDHPFTLFNPSTVFIEDRPKGMAEYSIAKAAAEVLVAELPRWLRHVRVINRRLPRLSTDQTATLFGNSPTSNLDVLLPLVREVMGSVNS